MVLVHARHRLQIAGASGSCQSSGRRGLNPFSQTEGAIFFRERSRLLRSPTLKPRACYHAAGSWRRPFLEQIDMFTRSGSWMKMCGMIALASAAISLNGCNSGPRPIETVRASADHRFKVGKYAEARDEYAEIVSRYPGDWDAQYKLGMCSIHTQEYSAARRALETAYTHKPNQMVADGLAEAIYRQGDESRLFAVLRGRAEQTQSVEGYVKLAEYSIALNDPDSAQTAIDTAIEIDQGRTTRPYIEAAKLAERLGHLEDAVKRLRQAYGINPYDQRIKQQLAAMGEDPNAVTPLPPGR